MVRCGSPKIPGRVTPHRKAPARSIAWGQVISLEQAGEDISPPRSTAHHGKETTMLLTIAVVLGILWLLGFLTSYTMGGFIHILLVLAIIVVLIRVIQGRKVLT